jgi:hypothetical protein
MHLDMPGFLDLHSMKGLNSAVLKELQNAHVDEFGIEHINIMYNPEVDQCYCLVGVM